MCLEHAYIGCIDANLASVRGGSGGSNNGAIQEGKRRGGDNILHESARYDEAGWQVHVWDGCTLHEGNAGALRWFRWGGDTG